MGPKIKNNGAFKLTETEEKYLSFKRQGLTHKQIRAAMGGVSLSGSGSMLASVEKDRIRILAQIEGRKYGFTKLENARHAYADRRATRPTGQIAKEPPCQQPK